MPNPETPNLMSLQGDRLLIEKQVLGNPKEFYNEVVHELTADSLGWSGSTTSLPRIGVSGSPWNAQFILEQAILQGDLRKVLAPFFP